MNVLRTRSRGHSPLAPPSEAAAASARTLQVDTRCCGRANPSAAAAAARLLLLLLLQRLLRAASGVASKKPRAPCMGPLPHAANARRAAAMMPVGRPLTHPYVHTLAFCLHGQPA